MGTILVLAIGLVAICGWKIFMLDAEQAEIQRERLLLERDRDAFLTYGGELPQMTERHRVLTADVKKLEDRRQYLEQTNASLETAGEQLSAKAARLTGAISELQTQLTALEAEMAENRAQMLKLVPEKTSTQKEVALLRAQEDTLKSSITQKQKQESALLASIEGLQRQKTHTQELLAKMTADREAYLDFEKQLGQMTARFEEVLTRTGRLAADYGTRLEGMEKFLTRLDHGVGLLDADRQSFAANLESLKKDHAGFAAFLKQNESQNRILHSQVELLTGNNKKFAAAMEVVKGLDSRLQTVLAAESAAIKRMAQEDAQTRSSLASAAQTLTQNVQGINHQVEQSQSQVAQTAELLAKQRDQLEKMETMSMELSASVEKARQTAQTELEAGTRLGHTAQTLATQAEIFRNRLDLASSQGSQMEKLIDTQTGRLKDLAGLARQLSEEIAENRRRGSRMEIMLGEIQTLLDRPESAVKKTVSEDSSGAAQ